MRTFKKIALWTVGVVVLLLVVAFLLPSKYKVSRDIYIHADKAVIFDLTCHFQKWDLWTPWTKAMDSTAVFALDGPDGQVKTKRTWDGKIMKDGEMIFTQLVPGELIAYDLSFQKGKYQSKGKITIETMGDSCKVTWIDEGELGYNPMFRYMGLFMGKMMGPDFEHGLAKLRTVAEQRRSWPRIDETMIPAQKVLLILDSAGIKTYANVMGKAYMELFSYMKKNNLKQTGAPFTITQRWDSVTRFSVMKIGVPVDKLAKNQGRITGEEVPEQHAVMAFYFGPYEKIESAYIALDLYCKEGKKEITGGPWEIYINDPMSEKDPSKLETHILFPVK